jgi:hypothetical protein
MGENTIDRRRSNVVVEHCHPGQKANIAHSVDQKDPQGALYRLIALLKETNQQH